jgi:hypothetical protein
MPSGMESRLPNSALPERASDGNASDIETLRGEITGSANDRYKAGLDDYLTSVAAQTALLANQQRAFS